MTRRKHPTLQDPDRRQVLQWAGAAAAGFILGFGSQEAEAASDTAPKIRVANKEYKSV
jgi:hypothetical protein